VKRDAASRSEARVASIILAAGCSSRMAPRNKLLECIHGEPMIRRVARAALASTAHPVIVVTGFQSAFVDRVLRDLEVTIVHNRFFGDGLSTSLHAGLRALPAASDGALICLGDMPRIEASVLKALITAFAPSGTDAICVPVHRGQRGNPVLWGSRYFAEMMAISGDVGAKSVMARHQEQIVEVEVATDSILEDIDAPADLSRINKGASS
jgi:molybdenum cofactor cytidylyltransferase